MGGHRIKAIKTAEHWYAQGESGLQRSCLMLPDSGIAQHPGQQENKGFGHYNHQQSRRRRYSISIVVLLQRQLA